jgi:endonuclease YncB( thermonuclease family)
MLTFRSALVLFLLAVAPVQALTLSGQAQVTDGDSLRIGGERIRLFGIDAPELAQRCDPSGRNWACGKWAKDTLQQIVSQGVLRCEAVEKDRYGRTVARCLVGQRDVAALMVRAGAATAFTRYSKDYLPQERTAKAEARGLWSGAVTAPGDYRQIAKRSTPAPADCVIKGNISAEGARIFHKPGQRDYAATKISPAKGEAFFCSEAEARAAGFRAAKR